MLPRVQWFFKSGHHSSILVVISLFWRLLWARFGNCNWNWILFALASFCVPILIDAKMSCMAKVNLKFETSFVCILNSYILEMLVSRRLHNKVSVDSPQFWICYLRSPQICKMVSNFGHETACVCNYKIGKEHGFPWRIIPTCDWLFVSACRIRRW